MSLSDIGPFEQLVEELAQGGVLGGQRMLLYIGLAPVHGSPRVSCE
jgi:hypothetical protein